MSRCFISCRCVDPDQQLAQFLEEYLEEKGHEVFIDTGMQVGIKWVEEIGRQIKSAEFFIVFLSRDTIRSDMIREEIKLAHRLSVTRQGRYKIVPIRVDYNGALPYGLAQYLDSTRFTMWREGDDFAGIAAQTLAVIDDKNTRLPTEKPEEVGASGVGIKILHDATEAVGAPLPAADPRFMSPVKLETGTIRLDSPYYIKRDADDHVMAKVQKQGSTTIINAPRQMGKSSLLARTYGMVLKDELPTCYIDFHFLSETHLSSLDDLFKYIALKIAKALKAKTKLEEYWDENKGTAGSVTVFLRKALLTATSSPVLVFFDEVDRLFNRPYSDDFFATIREWHNLRAREACWTRLNLVIAHTAEPILWIRDIDLSPFNVGCRVKLDDFDLQQVERLNELHGTPLKGEGEIHDLLEFTGGQPYLVRMAFYEMEKSNYTVSQLIEISLDERGLLADHLRRQLWALQTDKGLTRSLQLALRKGVCDFDSHFMRLRSAGLVRGDLCSDVQIRSKLYEDYFKKHL